MGNVGTWHTSKYTALVRMAVLNNLAYTGDIFARTTFIALVIFIFTQLWQRALPGDSTMAGFTGIQMVWYLLVTEAITLSRPHMEGAITDDVKSGTIAYQLIRPYSYVGYYMATALGEFLVRWPANLLMGSIVVMALNGPLVVKPVAATLALLATFFGACLSALFAIGLALTAFWFEENRPFFWIYSKLVFTLGGLFVPTEVYPGALRVFARWLPFEYMVSAPARLFVRFEWSFWQRVIYGQLAWLLLLSVVVLVVYRTGVKRVHVQGG